MTNEIKEILDETKRLVDNSEYKSHYHYNIFFEVEHIAKLLDYITNLQTIEQQYSAILSENAELENKITNLQEEIRKKEAMYDSLAVDYRLAQEKLEQYENPDDMTLFYMWLDEKAKDKMKQLEKENERLREVVENLTTMTVCGDRKQIKNTAQYKLEQAQSRIDKSIEWCDEIIGTYYENNNQVVLAKEIKNILQGEDKE